MALGDDGRGGALALAVLAAVTLYVSSRTAAGVLAGGRVARPGLRAAGHWLPVATTAVVALQLRRPEIAVALAFSTSVAALSFVLGVLTYVAPMDAPPASRRAWPFVLPAALLALVAGFSGQFNWVHALAMLVLGGAVFSAWREATARGEAEAIVDAVAAAEGAGEAVAGARPAWVLFAEFLLAAALAVVGGWAAVTLATRAAATVPLVSTRLVTVAVLTPLLSMPMLTSVAPERAPAHTASMASTLVALALLNLCGLLPLLTVLWHVQAGASSAAAVADAGFPQYVMAMTANAQSMPFPLATWRIDAVVLTVLGLAMVPVALGRWELGRWEAIGLVAGYALYLAISAAVSVRV
jgi:Ca2+/Na+ antiporter